jgi:transcriptional regulator with XRE-family HTH domain
VVVFDSKKPPPVSELHVSERRRAELGQFLRTRRARLSPEEFGMPAGLRRRTPGLHREELALLAGVGVSWYTWLEQGREINVSTQVLDALAHTLRLDRAERWHMYVLAEAVPVSVTTKRCPLTEPLTEILNALDPLPAVVTNARFDILAKNDAHTDLFRHWHSLPCIHQNTLWCVVTEPTAREKFPQYDDEVPYLVARFRAAYARHVGEPDWEEDIRRLSGLSGDFAELWARHEVSEFQSRTRTFIHPVAGPLTFTTNELQVPATQDGRITVYTPADDETRKQLPLTRDEFATQ